MSKKTEPMLSEGVYVFRSYHIGNLEGNILTFIDASIQDPIQRKALKDLLRPMVWNWAIENNLQEYCEVKFKDVPMPAGSGTTK